MLQGIVLMELQPYHSVEVAGQFTGLPSGYAVDGAQVACGSGGCP